MAKFREAGRTRGTSMSQTLVLGLTIHGALPDGSHNKATVTNNATNGVRYGADVTGEPFVADVIRDHFEREGNVGGNDIKPRK